MVTQHYSYTNTDCIYSVYVMVLELIVQKFFYLRSNKNRPQPQIVNNIESFIEMRFVLSRYREFIKIVVPILNKDGVRICSIGTLFLLCNRSKSKKNQSLDFKVLIRVGCQYLQSYSIRLEK